MKNELICGLHVQPAPRSALKRAGVWGTGPSEQSEGMSGLWGAGAHRSVPPCLPAAWPGQELPADPPLSSTHQGLWGPRVALSLLVWDTEDDAGNWCGVTHTRSGSLGGGCLQPAVHQACPRAGGRGGSGSPATHFHLYVSDKPCTLYIIFQRTFSCCSNIRYSGEWPSWLPY